MPKRWLYAPLCLFVLPTFGVSRLPLEWATSIVSWPLARWLWEHGLLLAAYLSLLGYLLAALVCLWLSYRTADTAGRRRLRVVMWGSLIGFGSLFLALVMEATNAREKWKTIGNWLWFSMLFTLPLVPLSFAYAIVRHRVIPISLIIRRGVRYLLVSRGSILLALLFVGLIVAALLALLLPLKTKDAMPGVVALGSRLGDLPFSGEDIRLLQSVGASASLALENAQLVERMIAEARRWAVCRVTTIARPN